MTKQDYLQELKAHNWCWAFGSSNSISKGQRNEARLLALAAEDQALKALYDAYLDFKLGRCTEPTVQENTQQAATTANQYNRRAIMKDAWAIARKAAKRFGYNVKTYLPTALAQAWAKAKARALNNYQATPKTTTAYFICIDENLSHNTRLINQPAIDQAFTDLGAAQAALQILSSAFNRPFIKTSPYFHL